MTDYSELIEKICDGGLSNEEQLLVDKLLIEDENFVRELEAQRDIMSYFDDVRQKERLAEYHQELLDESTPNKIIPLRKRTWLVAASVIFFFSISTFALYKIYNQTLIAPETEPLKVEQMEQQFNVDLNIQQYMLNGSKNIKLTGEKGSEIYFPAGCFLDSKGNPILGEFQLGLIEIIDPELISTMVSLSDSKNIQLPVKLVYLQAATINQMIAIDVYNAPRFTALDKSAMKGEVVDDKLTLKRISIKDYPLLDISPEMEAYQRYLDSKHLVDSLAAYYTMVGDVYHLNDQKGMVISEDFAKEVKKYVRKYEADKAYEAKINKARMSWQVYNKQREIVINKATEDFRPDQYLSEFGWYGIF